VLGCNTSSISCDDNDPCTSDTCSSASGCVHTDIGASLCVPPDLCHTGVCVKGVGCNYAAINCTNSLCVYYTCVNGSCVASGGPICDDNNACTTDSCVNGTGCVYSPIVCDTPNTCLTYNCIPGPGTSPNCQPNGTITCDDGSLCTTKQCIQGFGCVYTNISCSSTTPCNYPIGCDGASGTCILVNVTQLFDFCGVCLGFNECFFSTLLSTGSIAGITGGAVAGIVVACIIAALIAFWLSKRGYDYYKAKSDLNAAGAVTNPYFKTNKNAGEMC